MAKKQLKEVLKALDRDQLQELILDIYSKVKEAKEFLDFYVEPNEEDKAKQIKEKMYLEFFPLRRRIGKCRFAPCKRLISQFVKMGGSPQLVGELMIFLVELGQDALQEYGMDFESYHSSLASNLKAALAHAGRHGLYEKYKDRLLKLCECAASWGWGVYDICCNEIYDFCDDVGVQAP